MSDVLKVILSNVRLSFVYLVEPRKPMNGVGDAKYSTTILLPKSDTAGKAALDAAINAAIQLGTSDKWGGVRPAKPALPVYDGDGVRPSGELFGDECKGHWVFTASAQLSRKPEIVDAQLQPIMSASDVYSGMYANVSVRFYPYFTAGKKGIGCGLNNVMKVRDGEPLTAAPASAADDFATLLPQQPSYQQPVYQQPVYQQPVYQQPDYQQTQPQQPQQRINPITGLPEIPLQGL